MKALIVGGGIGGLAAAIALRRARMEAIVFEQSRELKPVGYALALSPNALLGLERLGLAEAVRARSVRLDRIFIRRWDGRVLSEVGLSELEWEMLAVPRGDLQQVLQRAAGDALRLTSRCTGFREEAGGVAAVLGDESEQHGDLLVGADGINSVIRTQLHGSADLRYAGQAWRAVTAFDDESLRGTLNQSWGPGAQFGLMPIGGGLVYWVAAELGLPDAPPPPGGLKAALLRRFGKWHDPIAAVIEATDEAAIAKTDVYDRRPLSSWGSSRVTLLGDAAHPMTPNLGQGAAQALEDAVVLASRLRNAGDIEPALRAYEATRIPRTTALVRRSRQLAKIAQLQNPLGQRLRDLLLQAIPERVQRAQQERIVRIDLD